jgi:hypothetical protein
VAEFDEIGRERFLRKYRFKKARLYFLDLNGRLYDPKAIAGAAHGYQHREEGALGPKGLMGGEATV